MYSFWRLLPVFALTLTVYARPVGAQTVNTNDIFNNAVTSPKIAAGAVTGPKIADQAVVTAKLGIGAVATGRIADGAVTGPKIADQAIVTSKLGIGAVVTGRIADGAVTNSKLAAGAVNASKIQDGSIGTVKLASGSVKTGRIADGAVTAAKLASDVPIPLTVVDATDQTVGVYYPTTTVLLELNDEFYVVFASRTTLTGSLTMFWETDDCSTGPFFTRTPDLALATHKFNDLIYSYADPDAAAAPKTLKASSEINGTNCVNEVDEAAMGWDATVLFNVTSVYTAPFSLK